MPPSIPRFTTVNWLDGPIRICSVGGRGKTKVAWAPWDYSWSYEKKRSVDLKLLEELARQ